ncbi:MAG: RNA polymerase sigma factor [Rhizobium sp.]|jgi:RNA polymerase sigma-70 factor (ECF subfamily)|nr:RNA polymerase sigma factor [Rhizobium sp.]
MTGALPFADRLVAFLPNMRRFALSLSGSADTADDLVQAACERALANQDSFDLSTRFDAWTFRIIRNLWIDQIRRRRTAGQPEDIVDHEEAPGLTELPDVFPRMELREVSAAIGELSQEQREVLMLVCVEDFSYRETAEILSLPIGTVMSRLARARRNLAVACGIIDDADRSPGQKG